MINYKLNVQEIKLSNQQKLNMALLKSGIEEGLAEVEQNISDFKNGNIEELMFEERFKNDESAFYDMGWIKEEFGHKIRELNPELIDPDKKVPKERKEAIWNSYLDCYLEGANLVLAAYNENLAKIYQIDVQKDKVKKIIIDDEEEMN